MQGIVSPLHTSRFFNVIFFTVRRCSALYIARRPLQGCVVSLAHILLPCFRTFAQHHSLRIVLMLSLNLLVSSDKSLVTYMIQHLLHAYQP